MASTYALPLNSSSHAHTHTQHGPGHGHSRSYNYSLLPTRSPAWPSATNGTALKKASSSNSLHDHALSLNYQRQDSLSPYSGSSGNPQLLSRNHEDWILEEAMKGRPKQRPRGESDLGRPAPVTRRQSTTTNGYGFPAVLETAETSQNSWFSLPEALTAVLVPLPYLLASLAYPASSSSGSSVISSRWNSYLQALARKTDRPVASGTESPFIQACTLSSGTLLLVGILARIGISERVLDRRKPGLTSPRVAYKRQQTASGTAVAQRILLRVLSIALPYYAAMQLGGLRTALVLVTAITSGLTCTDIRPSKQAELETWKGTVQAKKLTIAVIILGMVCDMNGLTCANDTRVHALGYLALAISISVLPTPLPTLGWSPLTSPRPASSTATSAVPSTPWDTPPPTPRVSNPIAASPLVCTPQDTNLTLLAGTILSLFTIAVSMFLSKAPPISYPAIVNSTLSIACAAGSMFFAQPSSLRTPRKVGAAFACVLITCSGYLLYPDSLIAFLANAAISGLSYSAVVLDTASYTAISAANGHIHKRHDSHHHKHHVHGDFSRVTAYLMKRCTPDSVLHSILIEKDSRRIAYFGVLNLAFMLVQFFYGFVSGSLGLLSDSIHMFFDCAGLAVGLAAAVMSKWPPSINFPYGYGKIDTLSGFANGIFLILVSVEIIFDALGRLREGHELQRLNELLVVSILGFLVNIVGLTAFGHAHHGHGHDHGHSHGHGRWHGHSHEDHSHGHGHPHNHSHDHKHSSTPAMPPTPISATTPAPPPTHHEHHHHDHENENMRGIFLHIMADALGSAAVIFSTLLTKYYGWYGWDPLASCLIAILIFISAVPLVKSAGMRLLLTLPDDVEYGLRNTLQEISSLRGVVGYSVPRFWLEDAGAAHGHGHEHEHEHGHGDHHCHDHSHGHAHEDKHEDHMHEHQEHLHTGQQKILGVIHIVAAKSADMEDVRERTVQFLKGRGMDVVVHVEREGEGRCWCGGGVRIGGP